MEVRSRLLRLCKEHREILPFDRRATNEVLEKALNKVNVWPEVKLKSDTITYLIKLLIAYKLNIVLIRRLCSLNHSLMSATSSDIFWKKYVESMLKLRFIDSVMKQLPGTMKWRRYALMFSPRRGYSLYATGWNNNALLSYTLNRIPINGPIDHFESRYLSGMNQSISIFRPNQIIDYTTHDDKGYHSRINRKKSANTFMISGSDNRYNLELTKDGKIYINYIDNKHKPILLPSDNTYIDAVIYIDLMFSILAMTADGRLELINYSKRAIALNSGDLIPTTTILEPRGVISVRSSGDHITIMTDSDRIYKYDRMGLSFITLPGVIRYSEWSTSNYLGNHYSYILSDGTTYSGGSHRYGQLGIQSDKFSEETILPPTKVDLHGVVDVLCIDQQTLFLCER